MEENKVRFRYLMLSFIEKAKIPHKRQTRYALFLAKVLQLKELWFARFKAGDFNLEDQERPSKLSITNEDQIKILIENPRYTIHKLAEMLNV